MVAVRAGVPGRVGDCACTTSRCRFRPRRTCRSRARRHSTERGHLRDALLALDAIGPGDPLSAEADRLRAAIQSKLLEAARLAAAGCNGRDSCADEMPEVPVHQL